MRIRRGREVRRQVALKHHIIGNVMEQVGGGAVGDGGPLPYEWLDDEMLASFRSRLQNVSAKVPQPSR